MTPMWRGEVVSHSVS